MLGLNLIVGLFVLFLWLIAFIALVRIESHTGKMRKSMEKVEALVELHVKESAAMRSSQGFRPAANP